ncbi:hypothetical protein Ancab_030205 [Ancistrocladus abbreviatus]
MATSNKTRLDTARLLISTTTPEQIATSLKIKVKEKSFNIWVSEEEAGVSLFKHLDYHPQTQKCSNGDHDEDILVGTEGETEKLGVAAQSPYKHTAMPMNLHSSPADQQSTGSKSDQLSSRWSPRVEGDGPNLENCDRHKSPESRRYIGNEARAEEQDQGENNIGTLIAGQQSGDGDLHGG